MRVALALIEEDNDFLFVNQYGEKESMDAAWEYLSDGSDGTPPWKRFERR